MQADCAIELCGPTVYKGYGTLIFDKIIIIIIIIIIINTSILHAKRQTVLHVRITDVESSHDQLWKWRFK